MPSCFYRMCSTQDPEERFEDAAMAKALHDVLGEDLAFVEPSDAYPDHGLHLGRSRRLNPPSNRGMAPEIIRYWEDPAFRGAISRDFHLCDFDEAERKVRDLHASGRDAFVKSTLGAKHMTLRVPRGVRLSVAMEAMVYSFIDRPPCLLVQEAVDMRFERRFLVMNGEIVTQSAVGFHLTPMSRVWEPAAGQAFEDLHLETPDSRDMIHHPGLTRRMTEVAREIVSQSDHENFCMDLCLIGSDTYSGRIEPIEWNPMQPGMVGLFGCDPRRIAQGVRVFLEMNPHFAIEVSPQPRKVVVDDPKDDTLYFLD